MIDLRKIKYCLFCNENLSIEQYKCNCSYEYAIHNNLQLHDFYYYLNDKRCIIILYAEFIKIINGQLEFKFNHYLNNGFTKEELCILIDKALNNLEFL